MWIDTHCHLNDKRFKDDRQEIIQRAREQGLTAMIDIGCETDTWQPSLDISSQEPDIYSSLGLHPHNAKDWNDDVAARLETLLQSTDKIVAIGEMGLDYYYNHSPHDTQIEVFHKQLEMAEKLKLPAVFHIRDAHQEALAVLNEHPEVQGIVHCFTGNRENAEGYLELGHAISFSGIVTFNSAKDIQDAACIVPLERMLVETDAPYLAPVPKRGKRNEPSYVQHTGAYLAGIRYHSPEQFAEIMTNNARRLFRFPESSE